MVAQDTTRYGKDLYGEPKLAQLLTNLCKIPGIEWIRVLYTYPDLITDELLDVMSKGAKAAALSRHSDTALRQGDTSPHEPRRFKGGA